MFYRLWLVVMCLSLAQACAESGPGCEGEGCEGESAGESSETGDSAGGETSTEGDDGGETETGDSGTTGDTTDETTGDGSETEPGDDDSASEPAFGVTILSPANQTSAESGQSVAFEGAVEVTGEVDVTGLVVRWISDVDGVLFEGALSESGSSEFSSDVLTAGYHQITFRVEDDQGDGVSTSVVIGVCGWTDAENFDAALDTSDWIGVPGSSYVTDAYRDERGWLEMTGNVQNKKGAIFNVAQAITPGNVVLRFKISTGQCATPDVFCNSSAAGADGFAMSVFQVGTEAELIDLLSVAHTGGGLGYGVAGGYGSYDVPAFHIEFDTWHNVYNGNSEHHTDPMSEDHIAVTLNGNPGEHYLPTAVTDLEDNMWHQMEVRVVGEQVTVSMDEVELMSGTVPGLTFKGGYIGFTGSTGYYTNYHRFDDLEVEEACRF